MEQSVCMDHHQTVTGGCACDAADSRAAQWDTHLAYHSDANTLESVAASHPPAGILRQASRMAAHGLQCSLLGFTSMMLKGQLEGVRWCSAHLAETGNSGLQQESRNAAASAWDHLEGGPEQLEGERAKHEGREP